MDPEILDMLRRSSRISLDREGRWHHEGTAIQHERICALFDRGIGVSDKGEPILRVGHQWCYIDVEETLYIVREVLLSGSIPVVRLNDLSEESLVLAQLSHKGDTDLYCLVKQGQHRARFGRRAFNALIEHLDSPEAGGYRFCWQGSFYPIQPIEQP